MTLQKILLLAVSWSGWCFLHSYLISRGVGEKCTRWLGRYQYHYRLLYNLFSLLTLLPVMGLTAIMRGDRVFGWSGRWVILQLGLLLTALLLFRDGAKHYDMGYLSGVTQIRKKCHRMSLAEGENFSRSGSHGIVRHPWYLGTLLLLWSALPVYHMSSVVTAGVLSIYVVIGTVLEERKLVVEYGDAYRTYQRQVSMLFPWKWIRNMLRGKK